MPAKLLEITALAINAKPALRFVVAPTDLDIIATAASNLGLGISSLPIFLNRADSQWALLTKRDTGDGAVLVALTQDNSADEMARSELSNPQEAGIRLGYPRCCAQAVSRIAALGPNWPWVFLEEAMITGPLDARLNRFAAMWGGIGLLGELFPCSLRCVEAAKYADVLYNSANTLGLRRLAAAAVADALAPVRVSTNGIITKGENGDGRKVSFKW